MELYIAGGCTEHGRNCFLVKGKRVSFLVDAGLMKEKAGTPYPRLTDEQIAGADYLFLTHCHTDHTGALLWLYEHGFRGKVYASRATLDLINGNIRHAKAVDEICEPREQFRVGDRLRVRWGRSGHCIGSVWFRFRVGDKSILFSGDYTEHSLAYRCDRLRDVSADIAVLDCAYGRDDSDGRTLKREFRERMRELAAGNQPLLFPVPAHGRGADVIRELAASRIRTAADPGLCAEIQNPEYRRWLRKSFREDLQGVSFADPGQTVQTLAGAEDGRVGILVRDSQMRDQENRDMADRILAAGGKIVLTGKQDPASYSRLLLKSGKAEFDRIPVHQNTADMEKLIKTNRFRFVIPYHCRQELAFDDRRILTVRTGDTVRF
ncbi:MAG: MBL fold metallo-hydrolase [Chordicoccus sp.]